MTNRLDEFNSLVEENRSSTAELAEVILDAKTNLSKKEYKAFIEASELSKDQVSRLLKRGRLLAMGFGKADVGAYSDSAILKLTNKNVDLVEELVLARKELAKGEIEFEDFKVMYDSYKVVKSPNEKFDTKCKGILTALDKLELSDECLTRNANNLKEFVNEWGCEELA